MYVITAHQRHRQTDRQTDVKRSHDRFIAKACSGKNTANRPTKPSRYVTKPPGQLSLAIFPWVDRRRNE